MTVRTNHIRNTLSWERMVTSVVTEESYSTHSCWCTHPDLSHSITAFRGRAHCIYMVVEIGYLKLQGPSQTTWPPLELTDKIPTFPMKNPCSCFSLNTTVGHRRAHLSHRHLHWRVGEEGLRSYQAEAYMHSYPLSWEQVKFAFIVWGFLKPQGTQDLQCSGVTKPIKRSD